MQVYIPLNIKETHWVLGRIDLPNRHVDIYDSTLCASTDRNKFEVLFEMLPYLMNAANLFNVRPDLNNSLEPFTHKYIENCPRQEGG